MTNLQLKEFRDKMAKPLDRFKEESWLAKKWQEFKRWKDRKAVPVNPPGPIRVETSANWAERDMAQSLSEIKRSLSYIVVYERDIVNALDRISMHLANLVDANRVEATPKPKTKRRRVRK